MHNTHHVGGVLARILRRSARAEADDVQLDVEAAGGRLQHNDLAEAAGRVGRRLSRQQHQHLVRRLNQLHLELRDVDADAATRELRGVKRGRRRGAKEREGWRLRVVSFAHMHLSAQTARVNERMRRRHTPLEDLPLDYELFEHAPLDHRPLKASLEHVLARAA